MCIPRVFHLAAVHSFLHVSGHQRQICAPGENRGNIPAQIPTTYVQVGFISEKEASQIGQFQKISRLTTDGFHILTPHAFRKFKMHNPPPPCPKNSKLINPSSPSEFPVFLQALWYYLFDSVEHLHDQRAEIYMLSPLLLNILLIKMRANSLFRLLIDCRARELLQLLFHMCETASVNTGIF